jgi:hypothetical protein
MGADGGHPVVAWRVEGSAKYGRLIPIIEIDGGNDVDEPIDDVYAIRYPDGRWYFENAERCDNPAAVVAGLEKRLEASDANKPIL